jgi:hypothetical protein
MANDQSQIPLESEEEEKDSDTQPHNPACRRLTVPLAQPTPAKTEAQNNRIGTKPNSGAQRLALTGNARPVIFRIINILFDLIPPLFLQLSNSTKEDQLVQKANAKLEVALKETPP